MDINFFEPEDMPRPDGKSQIETLQAEPYPDGRRVKVTIKLTPFHRRPSLIVTAQTADGTSLGRADILEVVTRQVQITFHLRGQQPTGTVTLQAQLYEDEDTPPQHTVTTTFDVPIQP